MNVKSATQRAIRMQSVGIAMEATLVNVRMAIVVMATQTVHWQVRCSAIHVP